MRRYLIIFAILTVAVLIATGCAVKNSDRENNGSQMQSRQGDSNSSGTFKMNFGTPGTIADLQVGKKIVVMGTTNADGTVNAVRIMIGEMRGFNFGTGTPRFASGTPPMNDDRQASPQGGDNDAPQGFQPPQDGQFPPSTDGVKTMGDDNQNRQRTRRQLGGSNISGEIMEIDDTNIVLKIKDNGSKIIFYSDKTQVFIMPTSTPPGFPPRDASSSASGTEFGS